VHPWGCCGCTLYRRRPCRRPSWTRFCGRVFPCEGNEAYHEPHGSRSGASRRGPWVRPCGGHELRLNGERKRGSAHNHHTRRWWRRRCGGAWRHWRRSPRRQRWPGRKRGVTGGGAGGGAGTAGSGGMEQICEPGGQVFCKCPGGGPSGTKTCNLQGTGFGPCMQAGNIPCP
jgi:hypothetical protein